MSMIDDLEADPQSAADLAAARLASQVDWLLHRMREASTLTDDEIADLARIDTDQLSELFQAEGNVRIAALARYARIFGYTISITAAPVEAVAPLPQRTTRARDPQWREKAEIARQERESARMARAGQQTSFRRAIGSSGG